MPLSINPFILRTILIEVEKSLLIIPFQPTTPLKPLQIQHHLSQLTQNLKTASFNNYSFINASTSRPDLETDTDTASLQSIQSLKDLVLRLNNWITHQHSIMSASHESSFYHKMQESLRTTATLLHSIPQQDRLENTPEATPSTSQPFRGVKKRFLASMEQERALQSTHSKAKKSKLDNSNEPVVNSLVPLEERTSPLKTYSVTKIFFLQEGVFSLEKIEVEDLEAFFIENHEIVGQIITLHDNVFAPSKDTISALKYEEISSLRILSLKMLVDFMQQHLMFIHQISSKEIKQEICKAHFTLMNDLSTIITEMQQSTTASSLLTQAIASPNDISIPTHLTSHPYIGLRISPLSFSLSAKKNMNSSLSFHNFLKQISLASSLTSYKSSSLIPSIPNSVLNDHGQVLKSLYHITSRNYFIFCKCHVSSESIKSSLKNTLEKLNEQYCTIKSTPANTITHHIHLQNLAISNTNLPLPISTQETVSYVSLYPNQYKKNLWFIKETSFIKPNTKSKLILTCWLGGLKKHENRIQTILDTMHEQEIFLACNDNSWPISIEKEFPTKKEMLLEILLKISQHNLQICLDLFIDNSSADQIILPGYFETKYTLTKTLTSINNIISPDSDKGHFSNTNLTLPPTPSISTETLQMQNMFPFFSILKPYQTYQLKISYIKNATKFRCLKRSHCMLKKITRYLEPLLTSSTCHLSFQHNHQTIEDIKVLIPLIYLGLFTNYEKLKSRFKDSFQEKEVNFSETLYQASVSILEDLLKKLKRRWENIFPETPMPDVEAFDHPLKQEIIPIIESLKFNLKHPL
ncbi:hypothetical protein CLAVI_000899 [Candidatus Clavichlamydia salmonicola]|uniref:hypothetical protein n=1 Tax=Candidatus Clavichlamydia salmonicola TaxID=469812 RepID=UPI001890C119|nr:hypothetical protein [Candidatus Clavichlamydia salmonicola]MBF5051258.1 hypothetical protein [Candidatus Clavichlamydia salmonicola]